MVMVADVSDRPQRGFAPFAARWLTTMVAVLL